LLTIEDISHLLSPPITYWISIYFLWASSFPSCSDLVFIYFVKENIFSLPISYFSPWIFFRSVSLMYSNVFTLSCLILCKWCEFSPYQLIIFNSQLLIQPVIHKLPDWIILNY
jgi:hypothetical protein